MVSPTKLNSFIHRFGNSTGKGVGCPIFDFFSPLKVQTPCVQDINSSLTMSDCFEPLIFFQLSLYSTTINSTGAITYGQEALNQDPQADDLEIFPSFHIIVEWYLNPTFFAITVTSAPMLWCPPLFLSNGMFKHNLPSGFNHENAFFNHRFVKDK